MSRSHIGKFTPLHKAILAFATCVAAVAIFALTAKACMAGDGGASGVNVYKKGNCGVRIRIMDSEGNPAMSRQPWTISDDKRNVVAEGDNHIARVYIPAGIYYFNSGTFSAIGNVGAGGCDGTIAHTFVRSLP